MKRILIIGVGSIGERHLRCFQKTGEVEVVACETQEELGQAVAARYGCRRVASLEEAWQSGEYDAAVICTPAHTHIPIALECLGRGLHLLIEKPLSTSMEGVDALLCAERESQRVVRVAYVHRAGPLLAKTKELLAEAGIGALKQVAVTSGQHFPTFRPAYRSIYYARHATGGGAIQDALTHAIHSIEWLAGPVQRLFADADHQVLDGVEVEDTVNLVARLKGGVMASFAHNQFQAPNETTMLFHGELGSVSVELHHNRVGVLRRGDDAWAWHALPVQERDDIFIRQAEAFLAAIEGRPEPLATLEEAAQTLRVNLAALKSVREGRVVHIAGGEELEAKTL